MIDQPMKKNIRTSGFTLVEIMIAILILGLVLSTVYAAYSSTMKIVRDIEYENNLYKMARTTMDRLIKDLSSLQLASGSFDLRAEKKTLSNREFYSLSFSADQKGKAPVAVKIELALVNINDKEKPYKFMTKVFLPVKK